MSKKNPTKRAKKLEARAKKPSNPPKLFNISDMNASQFIRLVDERAILTEPNTWKPTPAEDSFAYPGRGPTTHKQWLACFYDNEKMPDGRPAPLGLYLLCDPKLEIDMVALQAQKQAQRQGYNPRNANSLHIYDVASGDKHDASDVLEGENSWDAFTEKLVANGVPVYR